MHEIKLLILTSIGMMGIETFLYHSLKNKLNHQEELDPELHTIKIMINGISHQQLLILITAYLFLLALGTHIRWIMVGVIILQIISLSFDISVFIRLNKKDKL